MGPRSIDRGIGQYPTYYHAFIPASMGPRSIDRGIPAVPALGQHAPIRFNGAAIDRSRNSFTWIAATRHGLLQWGRDRSIAEFRSTITSRLACAMLQWGRDRSIAEF